MLKVTKIGEKHAGSSSNTITAFLHKESWKDVARGIIASCRRSNQRFFYWRRNTANHIPYEELVCVCLLLDHIPESREGNSCLPAILKSLPYNYCNQISPPPPTPPPPPIVCLSFHSLALRLCDHSTTDVFVRKEGCVCVVLLHLHHLYRIELTVLHATLPMYR
jgi:hypothetical protein